MKHTAEDLKLMQALPLDMKVRLTKDRIRSWVNEFGEDGCYVSYSGGTDSMVLSHIVKSLYPEIPAVFSDTGLEYPSVRSLAIKNADVVLKPKMNFRDVITKYGYPIVSKEVAKNVYYAKKSPVDSSYYKKLFGELKNADGEKSAYCCDKWSFLYNAPFITGHLCCDVMKKAPFKKYGKSTKRMPIVGTMADESRLRTQKWMQHGCNHYDTNEPKSAPIAFWTKQDVLSYLVEYGLEIPSVYGDIVSVDEDGMEYDSALFGGSLLKTTGVNRTGCMFCGFGCHLEKEPNRFQLMKQTHPKLYDYCINGGEYGEDGMWKPTREGLGMAKVLDYIGVPYE